MRITPPMRCLLLLFLASCTTAEPRPDTLEKGAYRPVRPPVFTPAEDAPHTVGAPHTLSPGVYVEPGPRPSRVLPQTPATAREPGLWSGDQPRGAAISGQPRLFDVLLPFPPEAQTDTARMPTLTCAHNMSVAVLNAGLKESIAKLTPAVRECMAAKLYVVCAEQGDTDHRAKVRETGKLDEGVANRVRRTLETARNFEQLKCRGVRFSNTDDAIQGMIIGNYQKEHRGL